MLQEAKRRNVDDRQIARSMTSSPTARSAAKLTAEQFIQALRSAGVNPQTFKDFLRANLAWTRIVRARFRATVKITDQDVAAAVTGKDSRSPMPRSRRPSEYRLQPDPLRASRAEPPVASRPRRAERGERLPRRLQGLRPQPGAGRRLARHRGEAAGAAGGRAASPVLEGSAGEAGGRRHNRAGARAGGTSDSLASARRTPSPDRPRRRWRHARRSPPSAASCSPGATCATSAPTPSSNTGEQELRRRRPLALTLGEPAGIGPDIAIEAWSRAASPRQFRRSSSSGTQAALARRARALGRDVPTAVTTAESCERRLF